MLTSAISTAAAEAATHLLLEKSLYGGVPVFDKYQVEQFARASMRARISARKPCGNAPQR
jgi:hypothetical protein